MQLISTLLSLTMACAPDPVVPAPEAEPDSAPEVVLGMGWTADPPQLEFGEAVIGQETTAALTLWNTGESELTITSLEEEIDGVTLTVPLGEGVAAGASVPITGAWIPTTDDNLREEFTLLLSGTEGLVSVPLELIGTAAGAVAELTVEKTDLGTTALGCPLTTTITVRNTGNVALHVSSLSLDGAAAFALDVGEDPLPWDIFPLQSATATISFAPIEAGDEVTTLSMVCDDPMQPEFSVAFAAEATEGVSNRDTWTVPPIENVTGIIAVNQVINTTYRDRFQSSLPYFFETLQYADVPFRVAFTHERTGTIDGPVPYIDETMDAHDAADVVAAMVERASGDNDYLLESLEKSITVNREWLLDEKEAWATSKLNLVGINSDQEQSSGNYMSYTLAYRAFKDDEADIAVHGIGGDVPAGCYGAEAFTPFSDAATETGGVFLSICEADWDPLMEDLALAFLGESQVSFALTEVAVAWTLEVYVDDTPIETGWSFDASANELSFDADVYPAVGAELRVDYVLAEVCP